MCSRTIKVQLAEGTLSKTQNHWQPATGEWQACGASSLSNDHIVSERSIYLVGMALSVQVKVYVWCVGNMCFALHL